MKRILSCLLFGLFLLPAISQAQGYTFFIRQVQMPDQLQWDLSVSQQGSQQSALAINPNGARFELWAIKSSPLTSYLVDTTYVNSYVPVASVAITSEDPYSVIARTRADRPFQVSITVNGLSTDPAAPAAAQSVKLLRHNQSYPGTSDGSTINRSLATIYSQGSLNSNGTHVLSYTQTVLPPPSGDYTKIKGEERFSVFSLADYQAPESQLASKFIQIWPISSCALSGMADGAIIKAAAPKVTATLTDLYPDSVTYAQVYKGSPVLGTQGTIVPGASIIVNGTVPRTDQFHVWNWDSVIPTDGIWTLEVLTQTPFGIDRLSYISFNVERAIKVNGSVTSAD